MDNELNVENVASVNIETTSQATEAGAKAETETTEMSGSEKVIASAERVDGASKFSLYEDPETGMRYVRSEDVKEEKEAQTDNIDNSVEENEPKNIETQTSGEKEPDVNVENEENIPEDNVVQPYNLDEFSYAIASNSVDESRIPEEFKQQYGNFKVNQAIEEYNRRKEEANNLAKAKVQQQLTPEEQQTARKEFFREVDAQAKELALKDLGMTAEQYENAQYDDQADQNLTKDFDTAYAWHRSELMDKVHQMAHNRQTYQNQQKSIYQDIVNFREAQKLTEKNFNEIDVIMTKRYLSMPFEKGKVIAEAIHALQDGTITQDQATTIQKYYEDTKKEYYAKKAGLSRSAPKATAAPKAPPTVESSGSGKEEPATPRFTARDLRNAGSLKDRMAIFSALLNDRRAEQ